MVSDFHVAVPSRRTSDANDEDDLTFLLSAFDSTLSHLASIGSAAQWGTEPFSKKPKVVDDFAAFIQSSWECAASPHDAAAAGSKREGRTTSTKEAPWNSLVVATRQGRRVGACGVTAGRIPEYVPPSLRRAVLDHVESRDRRGARFLYVNYLVTHHGRDSKGVGAELVDRVKLEARQKGMDWLLVDCWSGNDDGLVRYYERIGFRRVGETFDVLGKHGEGLPWSGRVLAMPVPIF